MKIFRYWRDITLTYPFQSFALIPANEVREDHMGFEHIVEGVKKSGFCQWVMYETLEKELERSEGLNDHQVELHTAKFRRAA